MTVNTMRGFALAAALALAGCNFQAFDGGGDPALNAEAQANYGDLVAGRDDGLVARMSSENSPAAVRPQLPMLRKLIDTTSAPAPTVTGTQRVASTNGQFYVVNQDYAYPDRVAHVRTEFRKEGEIWKIRSFNVNMTMKPAAAAAAAAPSAGTDQAAGPGSGH